MNSHNFQTLVLIILASMMISSCQKKPVTHEASISIQTAVTTPSETAPSEIKELRMALVKLDSGNFKDIKFEVKPFHTDAHKKYLTDPMKFMPLPDQNLPEGKTAVVGSKVCVLYPNAKLENVADLGKLPAGIAIPFGTIIPIQGEKIVDSDNAERYGMFSFQDNWNWFYPTTYEGKKGLVYGADLYGLNDTNEANRISARLYQTSGAYDAFYPIVGYHKLPPQITARLEKDKLAFQEVSKEEYNLRGIMSDPMPDDMLALYSKHRETANPQDWNRQTPIFVTTDLAVHAQHLMFDRTLQYLEEAFFLPRLRKLNDGFMANLKARMPGVDSNPEFLEKAFLYFQVAQALLDLAPDRVEAAGKGRWEPVSIVYKEKDSSAILSAYPTEVRDEIAKIEKAEGPADSSVFAFKDGAQSREDYSQYKPRGHYTKNGALSAYFRAMMWFGRINFLIAESGPKPLSSDSSDASDSTALTLAMEPIALLITDVVKNDTELYRSWRDIFDPITTLIGVSDDLSFKDLMPLWKDQRVSEKDFNAWAGNKENLLSFMKSAHEKLRQPAISGNSVFQDPSEGTGQKATDGVAESYDRNPPMGWKLFGQRFTYDSAIHEQVSPPRLLSRDMVRGLDIMKAFGSQTAELLLQGSDYPKMKGLKQKLDALEQEFGSHDASFWKQTYYNSVLFQVKAQAQFEPGAGFYFTESPAWGTKAMLSSHGTWAELRHDTLLYATQDYAERAGDGDFEPTFRTEKIPAPVHYLEPNLPFWQSSAVAIQNFLTALDSYGLLDEESAKAFGRLQEIYLKAAEIVATEASDKPVSASDLKWIATMPAEFLSLVLVHIEGGDIQDEDQLKMALIADVFTNAELKVVLESGVGIPYRVYIPLNDGQGGKRIAIGYVFSYYEFAQPMGDRLTDEKWKQTVYAPDANLGKYQPFWSMGILLPSEPVKLKK
jgi:hypothetical protein